MGAETAFPLYRVVPPNVAASPRDSTGLPAVSKAVIPEAVTWIKV